MQAKPKLEATMERAAIEFHKAAQRLMSQRGQYGGARPCALAWAIAFAQENLSALARGGQSDRYEELKRFGFDGGLTEAILQGDSQSSLLLNISVEYPARAEPLDALAEIQREVRSRLDAYLRGEPVTLEGAKVSYEVTRTVADPLSGRVLLHVHSLKDAVLLHLFHFLAELGPRTKSCLYCDKLFLAGRIDKRFCSGACQAKQYKRDHPLKPAQPTKPRGKRRRDGRPKK